jgi:hypothetical protein
LEGCPGPQEEYLYGVPWLSEARDLRTEFSNAPGGSLHDCKPRGRLRPVLVSGKYAESLGSVYEIRDHLTTALDAGYITPEQYKQFDLQAISVIKLINGYIRATRQRKLQADARQ